ncbi:hypothetical protein [Flavobacterium sp. DSR3-2]
MKVNKRDLKIFTLGIFSLFIFQSIYDWKQIKKDIISGWNTGYRAE